MSFTALLAGDEEEEEAVAEAAAQSSLGGRHLGKVSGMAAAALWSLGAGRRPHCTSQLVHRSAG